MEGYMCEKCGEELLYELIEGMRVKRLQKDGSYYYSVFCPKCNRYYESEK